MMNISAPLSSSKITGKRKGIACFVVGSYSLSFVFPLLAGALPAWVVQPLGAPSDWFPGLRHVAHLCVDPAAAAAGLSLSLLLAISLFLVFALLPAPAEPRAGGQNQITRGRSIFAAIVGAFLLLGILFNVPGPPTQYQLSHAFNALVGKSHVAVAFLCFGLCVIFSTYPAFAYRRLLLGER